MDLTVETPPAAAAFASPELFDLETYPINKPGSAAYLGLLGNVREALEAKNCAQLENFIRWPIVQAMQSEAAALAPRATYVEANLNPYFSVPPEDTPDDHPLRRFSARRHGMVRGDHISRDGAIWAIFQSQELCNFVADALGYERLFTYRDPYSSVNVNVQPEGCEFAWHFDNNDFTVSFGLHQPAEGGAFEYVPNLRSAKDENYDAVKRVLDGAHEDVRSLKLRPGDLQLFKGGYTLHRVTAPIGDGRQSLLLSYVVDPANVLSASKAERIWGEAHAIHRKMDARLAQ